MPQKRPPVRSLKARGAFACRLLFLGSAGLLLLSCEFTLFPEGINPPEPTPTPGVSECTNPFPGLASYKTSREIPLDITLKEPASVAVVPPGMGFSFTPPGTTGKATAEAGDVLVADLHTNEIFFYHQRGGNVPTVFPAGAQKLSGGLALYGEEVDVAGGKKKVQLLLYTGISQTTGDSNLFLHDLGETPSLSPNPFMIPDHTQGLLPGETPFHDAQAVAVGRSGDTRGVFVSDPGTLQNDHSIYRISLVILNAVPVPENMSRVARGFKGIQDVGFSHQTKALYLTENDASPLNDSTVYRIASALTTSATVNKSALSPFVPTSQLKTSTGLTLAPTRKDGTTEDLLVLSQEVAKALGRFNAAQGGFALDYLSLANVEYRQNVAYDCTHARILFTRRGFSQTQGLYALTR